MRLSRLRTHPVGGTRREDGARAAVFVHLAAGRVLDKERYTGDYTSAPRTLVEFQLEKTATGTLLTLTESGFANVPASWRDKAFHGNEGGWTEQMKNIESYVAKNA